jgi:GT2 family glycosyltransferase
VTSIVIVNWNTPHHLTRCVEAVRRHTKVPCELILVDNGSREESRERIEALAAGRDDTRVLLLPENLGYAAGNNRGLALARGDTVCLLNSDAFVTRGWLESLLALMERTGAGLVGPCTNRCKGPQRRKLWLKMFPPPSFWRPTREVSFLSFFCVVIQRRVSDAVGILDERFGIGCWEDVDFCDRARAAGFSLWIDGGSWVWHEAHATFSANDLREEEERARNRTVYQKKWEKEEPPVTPAGR